MTALAFLPGDDDPRSASALCFRCDQADRLRPSGLCPPCSELLAGRSDIDPKITPLRWWERQARREAAA